MSESPIRVALLSFWHVHAKDYARQVIEHPRLELAAIWDEDDKRGRAEASARGVPYIEHLESIWKDATIDGVIVTTSTREHFSIITAAARAHKHIFTEKVIALTVDECTTILKAVEEANVVLTVSLPRLSMPFMQGLQQLVPLLGDLTLARARLSHSGALPTLTSPHGYLPEHFFSLEQAGGGALIDLGCHPMYVVRALLGMPQSLVASFGYVTNKEVEDNAVVILRYADGALAIVESGFVNTSSPFTVELHGKYGSAVYSAVDGMLKYKSSLLEGEAAKQWHIATLPQPLPTSLEQWVTHIQQNTKNDYNINIACDLTRLMSASIQSNQLNMPVEL